jgi:uncharacterized metal-binding protein
METGSLIWKLSLMFHVVSNAIFFGISFVFSFANDELLKEKIVKKYIKISSIFISFTGISGIILLSILSMNGMDNLMANPIGQSVLVMIIGYTIVLFVFILALIYKGDEAKIYRRLFSIMFYTYLTVYLFRVFLIY